MASTVESPQVRDQIVLATLDVILEYHISGTTTRKIAERAGVSHSLVHYYFPTKRDVFLAVIDYLNEFYRQDHASFLYNTSIKPREKLMIMIYKQIEYITRRREYYIIFDFWTQAPGDPEIREKVKELFAYWETWNRLIVEEGIKSGDFSGVGARTVPNLLISLIAGAAIQYLINEQVFNLHSHFDEIYRILIRTLCADPAPDGGHA